MLLTFDGPNKLIVVNAGVASIDAKANLYSEWKAWVLAGNAEYLPAFRVVGGDPIDAGISVGAYFFLQNQHGWRIRPDANLDISGNLYPEDVVTPIFVPALSGGTFAIKQRLSSLTQVVNIGGSAMTTTESAQLQSVFDITGGGGFQDGTRLIMYAADNATIIAQFDLYDSAGLLTSDMNKVVKQVRV